MHKESLAYSHRAEGGTHAPLTTLNSAKAVAVICLPDGEAVRSSRLQPVSCPATLTCPRATKGPISAAAPRTPGAKSISPAPAGSSSIRPTASSAIARTPRPSGMFLDEKPQRHRKRESIAEATTIPGCSSASPPVRAWYGGLGLDRLDQEGLSSHQLAASAGTARRAGAGEPECRVRRTSLMAKPSLTPKWRAAARQEWPASQSPQPAREDRGNSSAP